MEHRIGPLKEGHAFRQEKKGQKVIEQGKNVISFLPKKESLEKRCPAKGGLQHLTHKGERTVGPWKKVIA